MKQKCKVCGSTNTEVVWGYVGTFVSYYTLVCNNCGHKEQCRTNDGLTD